MFDFFKKLMEKRYTETFMLGIAFLVKYEAVSFYNTSVKSILSSTVSIQKKSEASGMIVGNIPDL